MFGLIYCLLPILLFFILMFYSNKRKNLDWNIRKGQVCYNCKEEIDLADGVLLSRILDLKDFKILCKSCDREIKISQLQKPYLKWKYKFHNYLVSKSFKKIYWIFPIFVGSIIFIDVLSIVFGNKLHLWPIYGTLNIIFYSILFYKLYFTSIKKPSE